MIKINKCKCGCGKSTNYIWATGHNLKVNPKPENLGNYIKGKRGAENPYWKGGIVIRDGYKYIYNPFHPFVTKQGYVCEHRLIMESKLKRYLAKEEIVHHKDKNKLNNIITNLNLLKNQAEHNTKHNFYRNEQGRFISGGAFL